MNHLATDLSGLLIKRVIECLVFDIIVIEITSPTKKYQIGLHEKGKHFVKRRVHARTINTKIEYLLRLFIE